MTQEIKKSQTFLPIKVKPEFLAEIDEICATLNTILDYKLSRTRFLRIMIKEGMHELAKQESITDIKKILNKYD